MATSGYFNTTPYDGRYLQFSWTRTSQSIPNNTSTISWTLKGAGTGGVDWYNAGNFKVVIAGEIVYSNTNRIKLYNGTVVATGKYTLQHNADGSKSFTASAEAGIYAVAVNCRGSNTFELDDVPRASQPSCITYPEHTQNVGEFGDTISIHMNRVSSAFNHTVRYQYGTKSGTIGTKVGTGIAWTIPLSFMDLLPSGTSGSGTIYVDTYAGETLIGTKSCGFTAKIPASVKPGCTMALEDTTGVDKVYGSPVKGLSKIKITVTGTPVYSSPIASYSIAANGVKYATQTATTGFLLASGKSTVTATVKDKRGRSNSASYDMTVLDYAAPSITKLAVHRCNQDGTENSRGEYVKVTFSGKISSMSSKNNALWYIKYKKSSASSYTQVSLSALANVYSVTDHSYIFAADSSSSYDVEVVATDRHSTATRSSSASTAFTLLNVHANGNGLRFGGVAEEENTFQNDLSLRQVGNSYAFQPDAFNGEKGYTVLAQITLNTLNVNAPIVFKINRRGAVCPMNVYVRFASSSTSTDPDLGSITYEGDNYGAFLVKTAVSTWKLYVDNSAGWSNPCLQEWFTTDNQMSRIAVTFPNEQVATLPTPYYRATPVISQSILDAFYPVGYILLLYSHADPNSMYPGSTWERLENTLLWATTPGGVIGWVSAQAAKATSGGYAFTQVSVWRRTA